LWASFNVDSNAPLFDCNEAACRQINGRLIDKTNEKPAKAKKNPKPN
jgi:hypothetical protein